VDNVYLDIAIHLAAGIVYFVARTAAFRVGSEGRVRPNLGRKAAINA